MNAQATATLAPGDAGVSFGQVKSMRTMFGSPRIAAAPVLDGSAADEAISNPKIAIIDDGPTNIKVVQKHLQLAGYRQFFTTTNPTQAIDLVCRENPDVVLLDIMMPEISGLEILERLRGMEEFVDLPVIILTAANDKDTKLAALRLGANDFLGKPVDSVELQARMRNVLAVKAHQDRLKSHAWELEIEVAARSTELAQAHREVLECLAKVGEFRDNETGRHVVRVGRYAEIIARRLGLSSEIASRIGQVAPLHDIGKVGIPDSVLLKPGKLDDAEQEQMRQHCEHGQSICTAGGADLKTAFLSHASMGAAIMGTAMSPLLNMAGTISQTHHERWDGKGYPRGLAGEEIPIEGRITAVADVFDALTNARPYKPAFSVEKSLGILREGRGTQFDPTVLDAFFAAINEILEVCSQHAEGPPAQETPKETAATGL